MDAGTNLTCLSELRASGTLERSLSQFRVVFPPTIFTYETFFHDGVLQLVHLHRSYQIYISTVHLCGERVRLERKRKHRLVNH